jgi:hypothetical protein
VAAAGAVKPETQPSLFPWLASAFACLCIASAVFRIITGWRLLA